MVNGALGGLGHYNGVATGRAEQLAAVKNTPQSGNEDTSRYFDALLASDALQEYPNNPFKTSNQGSRQPMRNVFTFQIDLAGGFNPNTSFGAGMTDPGAAFYDCALVVSGGQGGQTIGDSQDTTRYFLRQNPLPNPATIQQFATQSVFGNDENDWNAPGDFAYVPVLSSSASLFGDSTGTVENEVYKWGTAVTGYMFFAYGDRSHKGRDFEDEAVEFIQTGMPGYGAPGVDTLYENYALQCFEGAIYFSKKF
jgi:hypothetical protein